MIPAHVWADDLTGAAEVADLLALRTGRTVVLSLDGAPGPAGAIVVHDLDLRHSSRADAHAVITARLARIAPSERVFVKLDSQLHGPVAGYLAAMVDGGRRTLLSAANPALGRVTNGGVHRVSGPDGASTRLGDLLAGVRHRVVDRDTLVPFGPAPAVLAADATDQRDLDALARIAVDHGLDLAGGAALLAALLEGGHLPPAPAAGASNRPGTDRACLVAVVGSSEPAARAQLDAVRRRADVFTLDVSPGRVPAAIAAADAALATSRDVVLARSAAGGAEDLAALANAAAAVLADRDPAATSTLLTGGHTARLVLDRLGVRTLTAVPDRPGAVVRLRAPSGLTIFTKPGSYGGTHALADLLDSRPPASHQELR